MTPNPDTGILAPRTRPASAASTRLLPWLALAALFVVAVALRHLLAANTDVSWLLTVGERVLSGQRLYVDVIETNPPMAVFAYLPGILLARALGMTAEIAVDVLVFIGIAARGRAGQWRCLLSQCLQSCRCRPLASATISLCSRYCRCSP
jgi:hypothetical protein